MAIYILEATAGSSPLAHRLRGAIPDLISVDTVENALRAARSAEPPSCLLLLAPSDAADRVPVLADLAAHHRDRMFFLLIGGELSAKQYKSLVSTGAADWVPADADTREIHNLISGARARSQIGALPSGASTPSRPVAISFIASAGGVGNTTLSVEVGVCLKLNRPTKNMSICILDLDLQSSHVCDFLDIEPRLNMQEISSNPDRLDAQLFDIFVSRHVSGLHVFASPRSKADPCDLNIAALDKLLDMIATRYQLVLLDMPVTWFSWTPQVVSASDGLIITGVNTIPGLRQTTETLAAVREIAHPSAQVAVAVNRCQRQFWGRLARRHHAEKVLGSKNVFYIVDTPIALESINAGTPMMLGKNSGSIARDIAALARFCADVKSHRVTTAKA